MISTIEVIKSQISIEEALHLYTGINRNQKSKNKSFNIICPFHNDRSPSFTIWPERNTWKCWAGCGHGDVINLVSKIHSISNKEAIFLLSKQLNIDRKWTSTTHWKANRKLLIGFGETRKQLIIMLLEVKSLFEDVLRQVASFEDIDRLGDVYHIKPLIEKYLEELESKDLGVQVTTVKYLLPLLKKWRESCEQQPH